MPIPPTDRSTAPPTSLAVSAIDGYSLAVDHWPATGPSKAWVILNSATATRRRYYRHFAEFLTHGGFDVVTYDYRGIGDSAPAADSAPKAIRRSQARMRDWGQLDFPAVIDWCRQTDSTRPIFAVGHSVGGQILGLAPNNQHIAGMVFICAQHTWWGHWPKNHWPRLHLMWNFLLPTLSHAMGYFPSAWLGMGEPLPKGVALEWAAWARSRGYTMQAIGPEVRPGYDEYRGPILSLSFEDDTFAPRQAAAALLDVYPNARSEHRHIDPRATGTAVGHFGYFRPQFRDTFWLETKYWLLEQLPHSMDRQPGMTPGG
jgi:predicted alpha/beta hydrolase